MLIIARKIEYAQLINKMKKQEYTEVELQQRNETIELYAHVLLSKMSTR